MHHVFSDVEGLRIAVEMERRGEDFYRRAAKVSRGQEMVALLNALAADELLHGREFQRLHDLACARDAEARATFEEIARQERGHLARLLGRLAALEDEK